MKRDAGGGLPYVLFEPPTVIGPLRIDRQILDELLISWPGAGTLQFRESLSSATWQTVWEGPSPYNAGTPVGQGFYRLFLPCP